MYGITYKMTVSRPYLCSVITIRSFSHSWLITRIVIRVTRRVPLVQQEMKAHP